MSGSFFQHFTSERILPVMVFGSVEDMDKVRRKSGPVPQVCMVPGCTNKHCAKGLCAVHRYRLRKNGDPLVVRVQKGGSTGTCSIDGCKEKAHTKKLCQLHSRRLRNYGDPLLEKRRPYTKHLIQCSHPGCERRYSRWGYCVTHYRRVCEGTPMDAPIRVWNADDQRYKTKDGYIRLVVKPGTPGAKDTERSGWIIMEHRLVMQQKLGRPLTKEETVHHINGVRDDNRPENLEVWISSQPAGQRVADHVVWAREILAKYGSQYPIGADNE